MMENLPMSNYNPNRFNLWFASDALKDLSPIKWVVENLISEGSVTLLYGEAGSKKTYFSLDIAVCVASGQGFLDFPTNQCNVLYIDEESGLRRLMRRLALVLRGHSIREDIPLYGTSLDQLNLVKENDVENLKRLILEHEAGLVFIDALADVIPDADENSVKDIQPIFQRLRKIAEETNASIIIIHHTNKHGNYRGSTAMGGAVDLMLSIESKHNSPNIDIKSEKVRDVEPFQLSAVIHFPEDKDMVWVTRSDAKPIPGNLGKCQIYVLAFLLEHGASEVNEIVAEPEGCTELSARKAIYSLANSALIERVDSGNQGESATYDLTEAGRKYVEGTRL
jgi:archaellum biogenesis ATPase FlaH